ncbi:ferredoxin [Corynebacterium nasicanis]|uniref:Ferredoxin n=1 Tax=Corynebacterium nasicanis TaxID=1448267 RepID=A0ABW1QDC4_9CORY
MNRLRLDTDRCQAHGLCEQAAPDLVHLDDEDNLIIDVPGELSGAQLDAARDAVRACPVSALSLE